MRSTSAVVARLVGVAVAIVATLSVAQPADAHTDFDYSVPTDGASVGEPVSEVTVAFTQPVTLVGNGFEVFDPQQNVLQPFAVTDDDAVFRLQFDPPLAGGPVGVKYSVTAADGHVLTGSFSFTVSVDLPPPTSASPTGAPPTSPPVTSSPSIAATVTEAPVSPSAESTSTVVVAIGSAPTSAEILDGIGPSFDDDDAALATGSAVAGSSDGSDDPSNSWVLIGLAVAVAVAASVFLAFRARTSAR